MLRIFFVCLALVQVLFAVRPMNTDDARVVAQKSCQIESWSKFSEFGKGAEFWALPACNLFFDTEITIGANMLWQDSLDSAESRRKDGMQFSLKKVFMDLDTEGFSYGVALGHLRTKNFLRDSNALYGYALISKAWLENRLFLHTNLGAKFLRLDSASFADTSVFANSQQKSAQLYNLGVGMEYDANEYLWFMGEVFYEDYIGRAQGLARTPMLYQLGVRIWLARDRLQIDCTYGNDFYTPFNRNNAFVSVGVRILSEELF